MVRYIGMDMHREFAQIAVVEDGLVRDEGRIGVTPELFGCGLSGCEPISGGPGSDREQRRDRDLADAAGARVVVSNPSKTRAIAEAKVKTDKVDARILAQLLAADSCRRCGCPTSALAACAGR